MDGKLTLEVMNERVVRGVTLLDEKRPGWFDDIPVEQLNMGYAERCVLGWLYDDYIDGVIALGLDTVFGLVDLRGDDFHDGHPAVLHGFDFGAEEITSELGIVDYSTYAQLTRLWQKVITNRQLNH